MSCLGWLHRHKGHLETMDVPNNVICQTKLDEAVLDRFMDTGSATFDVQFILRCAMRLVAFVQGLLQVFCGCCCSLLPA